MVDLSALRRQLDSVLADRRHAQRRAVEERTALDAANARIAAVRSAQEIAQSIAQEIQQAAHQRLSSVVSRCLAAVFEESDRYTFGIEFQKARGKTEAACYFEKDGERFYDLVHEMPFGVLDIASLALRLAALIQHRPSLRRLLVLDEPCRHVRGKANRERTAQLIESLAAEFQTQFVICTDIEEFQLGKVIQL